MKQLGDLKNGRIRQCYLRKDVLPESNEAFPSSECDTASVIGPIHTACADDITRGSVPGIASRIATMEELSAYLFELALAVPEHVEMLFRLSDKAKGEAEQLRHQLK